MKDTNFKDIFNTNSDENTSTESTNIVIKSFKDVVNVKDASGNTFDLSSIDNIRKFGINGAGSTIKLNEEILQKTFADDIGDNISEKFTDVLNITQKIDIKSINKTDIISRVKNFFQDNITKVKQQYTAIAPQIDAITESVEKDIHDLEEELQWMESAYEQNKLDMQSYKHNYDVISNAVSSLEEEIDQVSKNKDGCDLEYLSELKMKLQVMLGQQSQIHKLLHLSLISEPEIRSLQVAKFNSIDKANMIRTTTIPIWKKSMALTIQAEKDTRRIAKHKAIDEFTNELIVNTSKSIADNMIESTKASQRDSISAESLQEATKNIKNGIIETIKINNEGNAKRKETMNKLTEAAKDIKESLAGITSQ